MESVESFEKQVRILENSILSPHVSIQIPAILKSTVFISYVIGWFAFVFVIHSFRPKTIKADDDSIRLKSITMLILLYSVAFGIYYYKNTHVKK